jgi:CBS domain-containing protein
VTTVGDIMSRSLLTVEPTMTLTEAARQMEGRKVGAVLVASDGRLTGILTERDVLRAVAAGNVESASVGEWMTPDPETVEASESVSQAGVLMIHGGFRHLPVLDGVDPIGIISIRDLVRDVIGDESPRGV